MKLIKKLSIGLFLALVLYLGFGMYSMFWSENLLRPVKNGMSESEVREVIGAPVSIIHRGNGTSMWDYNEWFWTDAVVHFGADGRVLAVECD